MLLQNQSILNSSNAEYPLVHFSPRVQRLKRRIMGTEGSIPLDGYYTPTYSVIQMTTTADVPLAETSAEGSCNYPVNYPPPLAPSLPFNITRQVHYARVPSERSTNGSDTTRGWASAIKQALMPVTPQSSTSNNCTDRFQQNESSNQLKVPQQGETGHLGVQIQSEQEFSLLYQIFADEVLGSGQFGTVYGGEPSPSILYILLINHKRSLTIY
ncbi:hypothetical protein AB6A40_010049 [Gnathostoma spinigerum]|uniref:Uncharacterized protein n=1 Tax=Gnathostoma spinigerum TaxID=75299 RepID=A0ABD6F2N2_9BILA